MEFDVTYGIVLLFVSVFISRIIAENAIKTLSAEEKVSLIDSFSNMRKYSLIPIILICIIVYGSYSLISIPPLTSFIIYIALVIALAAATLLITNKKLKEIGLPKNYIRKYNLARLIVYTGFAIWLVLIFMSRL